MKNSLLISLLTVSIAVSGQVWFRGQVSSTKGQRLPSVKITSQANRLLYKSDMYGNFGFSSPLSEDTLLFSCDGYDTLSVAVKPEMYIRVVLKPLPASVIFTSNEAATLIQQKENSNERTVKNESYAHTIAYPFQKTSVAPGIAFSANINRASYSNIRRLINEMENLLPPSAVRIEEMLNYFNFNYSEPEAGQVFHCASWLTDCPWNKLNQLFFINVSARKINTTSLPPGNLVFLIDVSGSMDMPNKLPLIKKGFIKMLQNLRPVDTISIVTFGEQVQVLLDGVPADNKTIISNAIEQLIADGNTPGEAGIRTAFSVARKRFIKNGNNRIILAADGDFNVGLSTEKELLTLIEQERQKGIYLSCLGVGNGNYKDSRLYLLAQKSHGNFAYIDNEQEAEKTLVTDITQMLFTIAEHVYLSVRFNESRIAQYRLLGYENDSRTVAAGNIPLRGGEIGAGHSLMAVFEVQASAPVTDSLIATLRVCYNEPQQEKKDTVAYACRPGAIPLKQAESGIRKATAVLMFGIKLQDNEFSKSISWHALQKLASSCFNRNRYEGKEFIELVNKAKKMYTHRKKYGGD